MEFVWRDAFSVTKLLIGTMAPVLVATAQIVQRMNAARGAWIAHADIHFVVRIVRSIAADKDAVGHELDGRSDLLAH